MINCSATPLSLLKASILEEITGQLPLVCSASAQPKSACPPAEMNLFSFDRHSSRIDANAYTLSELVAKAKHEVALDIEWLQESSGKHWLGRLAYNLRYNTPDATPVILSGCTEALHYGPEYALIGLGRMTRLVKQRARAVSHEIHKMLGFIRFHPGTDETLVAKPKLFHRTADVILRLLAPKYPENTLVLLLPEKALGICQGQLFSSNPEPYREFIDKDPFESYWEKYYRSQYIDTRKNIRLAQKALPKRYWDSMIEGQILLQESQQR